MTSKKVLLLIVLPLSLSALLFLVLQLAIHLDTQPSFFPLDDPQGSYTIRKSPYGNSSCEQSYKAEYSSKNEDYYVVRYKGNHIFEGVGKTKCFDIFVGKSMDINIFVNKRVLIKGEFVSSSKQCIGNACKPIGGPYVVLDIHSIKNAKK